MLRFIRLVRGLLHMTAVCVGVGEDLNQQVDCDENAQPPDRVDGAHDARNDELIGRLFRICQRLGFRTLALAYLADGVRCSGIACDV